MNQPWIYAGPLGMVNATAVRMKNGKLLVVDTGGTPEQGQAFAEQVAKQGEVSFVFLTHEHGDHLQGNQFFHCPLVSSIPAQKAIARMPNISANSIPGVAFSDRLQVNLGEPVVMQLMGGHCPGASVLYLPERKLLFTGDLVFHGRLPWMGQADFSLWIKNLDQLLTWHVNTVVPGHGAMGGKEILAVQRDFLVGFVEQVQRAASEGQTEEQILVAMKAKHQPQPSWEPMLQKAVQLALAV